MTRRRIAGAAAGLLLALILLGQSWAELPRRVRFIATFAPKELAVRRLGGSGAAFDRRYFSFLENARRSLPPATPGVAIWIGGYPPAPRSLGEDSSYLYLAAYYLAPRQVTETGGQQRLPRRWVTAAYGVFPNEGASGVLARLPEGTLLGPASGEPWPKRIDRP